jgi:hypothetical protein
MTMIDFKMWIAQPGNVETYEDRPNEMYQFYFERHMEQLYQASWWKEGAGVLAPGVQFKTAPELEASKRRMQWIFTNFPVVELDPDATVIDASEGFEFLTGVNTVATALTDILNASVERVYKVIIGDVANPTSIAKAGKFANISAPWTPTVAGEYIKLYAELVENTIVVSGVTKKVVQPTGNFLELERG